MTQVETGIWNQALIFVLIHPVLFVIQLIIADRQGRCRSYDHDSVYQPSC